MAKWFSQAYEIERLRRENQRLLGLVTQLKTRLGDDAVAVDIFGVSSEERQLVAEGNKIAAIKAYRERTGAGLVTAKEAIDSILSRGTPWGLSPLGSISVFWWERQGVEVGEVVGAVILERDHVVCVGLRSLDMLILVITL